MENNIRDYVEELFSGAPNTQQAYELKIELIQNLTDKYNDLVAGGKSQEDAYNITILGIGDVGELLKEIDTRQNIGFFEKNYGPYIPVGDKNRAAFLTAVAVMLYILSVVPLIILEAVGVHNPVVGVVLMFMMVALATGLLIYNSMTRPQKTAAEETVVGEFREWQADKDRSKAVQKAINSAFWPLVLAVYFLLSFSTGQWGITWIIFLIAPAVNGIIKASLEMKGK